MVIKQIKFTPKKISNLLTTMIISLGLAVLILVSMFLYNNFYQIITQTKEILILKNKVALDSVNLDKFEEIMDKLNKKITPKEITDLNSPF